jgi:hypothetical protein
MFPYNGWNCLRTCFFPALRRKKIKCFLCFKKSWHNPLEEISNMKMLCSTVIVFLSAVPTQHVSNYSACSFLFCTFLPQTYHKNIIVQLLLVADIETSQYTDWYGIKIHILLPHGPQHMEFGCLSEMLCTVPLYSTPKQYLKHRLT